MLILRWSKSLATRAEPVGIANFRLQVTSDNVQKRSRQQHTAQWSDQCSTTHPQYRININKETSRFMSKFNDEPPDMCTMTIPLVHLVVSQRW